MIPETFHKIERVKYKGVGVVCKEYTDENEVRRKNGECK